VGSTFVPSCKGLNDSALRYPSFAALGYHPLKLVSQSEEASDAILDGLKFRLRDAQGIFA
jgi:hypothetical protein